MKKFFKAIKRKDYLFFFEPRGNEWHNQIIKRTCQDLGLIHCVDPFKNKPAYGKIRYYRLHGINGYNYKFKDKDLIWLLNFINTESKIYTYVMFNNVYMFEDALRFKQKAESEKGIKYG
ncbi:MAG: DUF72 domain-containing protein, partial [Candidatus Omnitrophica bacterium]|nr:DUF72 domain-containing protein [Candidatus Omnitrophota bacterium]